LLLCQRRIHLNDNAYVPILSTTIALIAFSPVVVALCAYVGYPAALWIVTALRRTPSYSPRVFEWPSITITVPVYNAGSSIRVTLDHLIELDYPRERLQILVISDASDDATDDIVRSFAKHGVELLRIPERRGKTAAENAALAVARGDILVNVDSTILVPSHSLKNLVRVFEDPEIGVASGRDVSMGEAKNNGTRAESSYVGYEMWIRELETKVGSIVGASGCFYASRRNIHATALPPGLSWDFASALNAQLQGYRSVSVGDAICVVPRATEVRSELRRKVRTMARGLGTLFFYRGLMNPFKHGGFAVMLVTHKLLRWVPYLLAPIAFVALCILALWSNTAFVALGIASAGVALGIVGINWRWSQTPKPIALAGFVVAVFTAGFLAWISALRNTQLATWEPTERPRLADQNQQPLKTQLSV
jgi:cellulose synthase/poly-beta-1,6-N-acetylglucosamine synthase-like glycosyltransferase